MKPITQQKSKCASAITSPTHGSAGQIAMMPVKDIVINEVYASIFLVNTELTAKIADDMRAHGYDVSRPATITANNEVVDGHTRVEAAKQAGIDSIPCVIKLFDSEDHAFEYAVHHQVNRRNLTEDQLLKCVETLDKRKQRGGDVKSEEARKSKARCCANDHGKSAAKTAELLGTSTRKVELARQVIDHATEEQKNAIGNGAKSINKVAGEIKEAKKAATKPAEDEPPPQNVRPDEKQAATVSTEVRSIKADEAAKLFASAMEGMRVEAMEMGVLVRTLLAGIPKSDPQRNKALGAVEKWITKNR